MPCGRGKNAGGAIIFGLSVVAAAIRSGSELSGRILLKEIVGIEVEHFDAYSVLLAFRFPLVSFRKDLHPNWIIGLHGLTAAGSRSLMVGGC